MAIARQGRKALWEHGGETLWLTKGGFGRFPSVVGGVVRCLDPALRSRYPAA
jgi:hypothetical protein